MNKHRRIDILLVEDNPAHARLMRDVLQKSAVSNRVSVVQDGEKAMDFLHRAGSYADAPRPDLIILDLNLPRKDGREVLAEIKEDRAFRQIPVVILTTSEEADDIKRSYGSRANCYLTKPFEIADYYAALEAIERFWLATASLPSREADKMTETKPKHILLIEDHPGQAFLIRDMLKRFEEMRFDVEIADRLTTGVKRVERGGVDLVVLDLGLPDSSGVETVRALHEKCPGVPVLVVTNQDPHGTAPEAIYSGAGDYLVKWSLTPETLGRAIARRLQRAA